MSATEVTWDAYDAFRLGQDKPGAGAKSPADAVSRPSHPYGDPDRGFGHKGYPAISVTYYGAKEFCRWLSQATGAKYRLPTEAEWENACRTGAATGAAAAPPIDSVAWHSGNAGGKTHPVGKKAPNAWGLLDMLGNAGEWCTGKDGKPVLCGGTYLDPPSKVSPATRARQTAEWNERDPQLPKSKW
jgi:formylglycine-generating enzyme required for sulfatase activity